MTDFWGNGIHEPDKTYKSQYQKWKAENNFRKAAKTEISCRTCTHHLCSHYHDKNYHKCELLGISHGSATDIRLSYLCDLWREENETD